MTTNAPDPFGAHCISCDYELGGLDSSACPECGRTFDPSDPATVLRGRRPTSGPLRWTIGIAGVSAIGLPSWWLIDDGAPIPTVVSIGMLPGLIALAVTLGGLTCRSGPMRRPTLFATFLPAAVFLLCFATLAIHMHAALGGWPRNIGDAGFPAGLVGHADFTAAAFTFLLLGTVFVLPLAVVAASVVRPWRGAVLPLALCGLVNIAAVGAMDLAPDAFLDWWWD